MVGNGNKYRHLSRNSAHRQALLRNLVTSLFTHESITTTWPKAKEAQRLAERLITLGKKNTETSRRTAIATFFVRFSSQVVSFRCGLAGGRKLDDGDKKANIHLHSDTPRDHP